MHMPMRRLAPSSRKRKLDAPALRSADIFISAALQGSQAAQDTGVCSPDASGAGLVCCEPMWEKKRDHYAVHLDTTVRRGLRYAPLIVSCYGRAHRDTEDSLELMARQAARRMFHV